MAAGEEWSGGFLTELVALFRAAESATGATASSSDFELLAPLVRRPRRSGRGPEAPADPDPDVFWRIELFYAAVGRAIERRTGVRCEPLLKMHHEGYGRLTLVAGRLVVLVQVLRDAGSFGYPSLEALAAAGERRVAEGAELVERFPEVARFER